ncbi:hypothetical protein ROTAS13_04214 [Roseomonas sp. TAS13]|uniref:hypothetical protein n=1 Tax=Roseomonas sp. TAS13 TaxID=1926319 RepID=UPI0009628A9F|nr:hypothetical protein [Roseomonas sp. TAS13]GAV36527.1 hypothetical protein ROTAS13_04214 [Roseomonas sp. TAS13]
MREHANDNLSDADGWDSIAALVGIDPAGGSFDDLLDGKGILAEVDDLARAGAEAWLDQQAVAAALAEGALRLLRLADTRDRRARQRQDRLRHAELEFVRSVPECYRHRLEEFLAEDR